MARVFFLSGAVLLMHAWSMSHAGGCDSSLPASTPSVYFLDNRDGTVTDTRTDLIWKKCSEGQIYHVDTGKCTGTLADVTWKEALLLAVDVNSGISGQTHGSTNWRLPNLKELSTLVERKCAAPAINTEIFPSTHSGGYWSSTPGNDAARWQVDFSDGLDEPVSALQRHRVRLVRDTAAGSIRRQFPPFTSGDPDLLIDLWPNSTQSIQAAGFTIGGSGIQFNAQKGFNGNGNAWIYTTDFAYRNELIDQGTIYLEVEREAIAIDESDTPRFIQSTGDSSAVRSLFKSRSSSDEEYSVQLFHNVDGKLHIKNFANEGGAMINSWLNSQTPYDKDNDFVGITITWQGRDLYLYWDTLPIAHFTNGTGRDPTGDEWQQLIIGAADILGTELLGDYWIRRIQVFRQYVDLPVSAVKVTILGDSFMRGFADGRAAQSVDDYAAIFQVGSLLTYDGMYDLVRRSGERQSVLLRFSAKGSTENGHGWSRDVERGASPFSQATIEAAVAYDADYIICSGSVNDVRPGLPGPYQNILEDTRIFLDHLIDGLPNLKQIFFFETFPGHQNPKTASTPGWLDEFKNYNAQQAEVDGYRGKVRYIRTYMLFGGDNYNPEFTKGSSSENTTFTSGKDIHPAALGELKMSEIIFNAVGGYLK